MLSNPLVLLLLLALAATAYVWLRRQQGGVAPGAGRSVPPVDDLRTLGISDVRPAGSASATAVINDDLDDDISAPVPAPRRSQPAPGRAPAAARAEPGPSEDDAEPLRARAASAPRSSVNGVAALLDSLKAALGARGVALLRYDEINEGYEVVGRAGEGFGGKFNFPTAGNALHRVPADGSISLLEAETFGSLVYHARPDATVGHAAALAVEADTRHLLVADRGLDDGAFGALQLDLLGDFADLVARLLALATGRPIPVEPSRAEQAEPRRGRKKKGGSGERELADLFAPAAAAAGDAPAMEPAGDGVESEEPEIAPEAPAAEDAAEAPEAAEAAVPVPRRVILAEEIKRARREKRPLAFALVAPRGVDDDERADHARVEEELRAALEAADGTERVERFGDSLMGAFGYMDAPAAEEWARRVAAGAPVHIGVAMTADRHGPDELRAEAAAALHDAYERGEACVILSDE